MIRFLGVPLLLAAVVTASAPTWTTYHIKRGDNLTEIAQRYRVSVAQLIESNDLPGNGHLIYAGETLRIPGKAGTASSAGNAGKTSTAHARSRNTRGATAPTGGRRMRTVLIPHRVGFGDTLWGIAARYHVSERAIARTNKLRSGTVLLGSTLRIPVQRPIPQPRPKAPKKTTRLRATKANSFAGRIYPQAVLQAASRNRAILAGKSLPNRQTTRTMIVRTANAYGVDPSLALAIAWHESGWSQRHVSVANAIGVMQVLPSTGRWISSVVGRDLNLLKTRDNIVAGVALIKVLTGAAPLDKAVAGYYQGLGSVRRNGMFTDTKRYVANVLALKKRFEKA